MTGNEHAGGTWDILGVSGMILEATMLGRTGIMLGQLEVTGGDRVYTGATEIILGTIDCNWDHTG